MADGHTVRLTASRWDNDVCLRGAIFGNVQIGFNKNFFVMNYMD